jgi:hypothetical protein
LLLLSLLDGSAVPSAVVVDSGGDLVNLPCDRVGILGVAVGAKSSGTKAATSCIAAELRNSRT